MQSAFALLFIYGLQCHLAPVELIFWYDQLCHGYKSQYIMYTLYGTKHRQRIVCDMKDWMWRKIIKKSPLVGQHWLKKNILPFSCSNQLQNESIWYSIFSASSCIKALIEQESPVAPSSGRYWKESGFKGCAEGCKSEHYFFLHPIAWTEHFMRTTTVSWDLLLSHQH